jgi:ADP-ribose pyrophosphatase YjhB (NUDIX family)
VADLPRRVIGNLLQRCWRLSRGLTLGAQAAVIDAQDRILLIRHTYQPGWHFPGGGVERMETAEAALTRELEEEAGVTLTGEPELFGIYANFRSFPNDHIALFIVRSWVRARVPAPNFEIAEQGLFPRDALPVDISPGTARRLDEIFGGVPRNPMW